MPRNFFKIQFYCQQTFGLYTCLPGVLYKFIRCEEALREEFQRPCTGSLRKSSATASHVPTQDSLGDKPHPKHVTNLPQSYVEQGSIFWPVPWKGKPGVHIC